MEDSPWISRSRPTVLCSSMTTRSSFALMSTFTEAKNAVFYAQAVHGEANNPSLETNGLDAPRGAAAEREAPEENSNGRGADILNQNSGVLTSVAASEAVPLN